MLSYRLIRERGGGAEMKKSTVLEAEQEKGETGGRGGGDSSRSVLIRLQRQGCSSGCGGPNWD